jgi:hypothetical protein
VPQGGMLDLCSYISSYTFYRNVCHKVEYSSYVVNVHPVLFMEVCATRRNAGFM